MTVVVELAQRNRAIKNQTQQKTDAMSERYARLDDAQRFDAAQYLDLCHTLGNEAGCYHPNGHQLSTILSPFSSSLFDLEA